MLVFAVFVLFAKTMQAEGSTKQEDFVCKAIMKQEDRVKLHLKQEKASKFIIYRAAAKKDGTASGAYKRLTSLIGSNVTYTDTITTGKYYLYKACGYQKNGGAYRKICEGQLLVYGGWSAAWKEYQHCDARVTPEAIPLEVYAGEEFTPDGYIIYRRKLGENYKRLAVIKSRKGSVKYTDKDVETGKTYLYKARAYRYVNGKKMVGIDTDEVRLSAVNRYGSYQYEILTPVGEETKELTMKLTSEADNGELIFVSGGDSGSLNYYSESEEDGEVFDVSLVLTGFSYDNENWTAFSKAWETLRMKGGETIYLRFEERNGEAFVWMGTDGKDIGLCYETVQYNYLTSKLEFEHGNSAKAGVLLEYYH